jgi:dipeptidase D
MHMRFAALAFTVTLSLGAALAPGSCRAATDYQAMREKLEAQRPALRAALKPWLRAADATAFPSDKPGAAFGKYVDAALRVIEARTKYPEVATALQERKTLAPGNEVQRQALAVLLSDYLQCRYGDDLLRELRQLVGYKTFNDVVDENPSNTEFRRCLDHLSELARGLGLNAKNHDYETLEITLPAPGGAGTSAPIAVYTHADVVRVVERKWKSKPFELNDVGGRWVGLGVYDDKGPLLTSLFAMRVLRDSGLELQRPIVLVVATDAESPGAEAAKTIAKLSLRPAVTLAADGAFPLATGENGRLLARITSSRGMKKTAGIKPGEFYIFRMTCTMSENTVPAETRFWVLYSNPLHETNPSLAMVTKWRASVEGYQKAHPASLYETYIQDDTLHFFTIGKPVHSDLAASGENAICDAAGPLDELPFYRNSGSDLIRWVNRAVARDATGKGLGIAFENPDMGGTSVNPANFDRIADEVSLLVDIRWPLGHDGAWIRERLATSLAAFNKANGTSLTLAWEPGGWEPTHSEAPETLQRTLRDAFRLASGAPAPAAPLVHSCARLLPATIPFGPQWPESEVQGHGREESISPRELQDLGAAYVSALAWLAGGPLPGTP